MSLSERLKHARDALGLTQKEIASAIETSQQTWQVYESGKSVPGGKVLEGLAKLGININWLLTGKGEVKIDQGRPAFWKNIQAPGIGERIKILRGKQDLEGFAWDHEISINELVSYEEEKASPDVNFLAKLCRTASVNPGWLLLGKIPKFEKDFIYKEDSAEVVTSIDVATLKDILLTIKESTLELIDEGLADEESLIDLEKNAELIAYMYEDSLEHELKDKPLKTKKAKVKRLFGIARELRGG